MLGFEEQIRSLREHFAQTQTPVLSIYCDINPAKPENAGKAWLKRVKNTLKDLPEIRNRDGKRDTPLYDAVLDLLEAERPEARTLALFAVRDADGDLHTERLDLRVELPVVDLARGRVDIRYGTPYLTPLFFAVDEYERAGVLHLEGAKWRFYEVFLGEIREDEQIFAEVRPDEWREVRDLAQRITDVFHLRSTISVGRYDRLNPEERAAAKVGAWMHAFYGRLSQLLDKALHRLDIERLVLMGEQWQVSHFESYLSRGARSRIVARIAQPKNASALTPKDLEIHVLPALEEAERRAEVELLDRICEQPGLWGMGPVLDALQLGRVQVWVLPWSLEARVWRCPEDRFVAAILDVARMICAEPEEVALRDHVWDLAAEFGARLEFVRGPAEERLLRDMGGTAALLRW
ncbi:MAG: VLRF1 family aeRF1-type release factor [Roseiflexus sp.]|nr:VLRF1 family aeRF1-type release factor [Roseiflexus sp.]MCS7289868.1 VLRF1 family aeRF1-type release factor [Roseiflexus sp.]MDW8145146.1 VLRF1 family aeRF1-type release factor [Roseiflexaceae bacterium]MDW8231802.1 VLRF1 family aeRF1-type release factor [Roseiflexaceae bacterium]